MGKDYAEDVKKSSRPIFYFIVFSIIMIIAVFTLSACNDDEPPIDTTVEKPSVLTFVFDENDTVELGVNGELPSREKEGKYISGWYVDKDFKTEVKFNLVSDLFENSLSEFSESGYKLYAKWESLKTMTGVKMKDASFIYDGNTHAPEVENAPEGAKIKITCDKECKNVGEYNFAAQISAYGYVDATLNCKLTITKARVDLSGVSFKNKTVRWDGEEHSIEIVGELPDGVTVSYVGNGKKDVGEYEITAKFKAGENFEAIEDKHAILKIEPKIYTVKFVEEDGAFTEEEVEEGDNLENIHAPAEKTGYDGSWGEIDFDAAVDGIITVHAVYVPKTFSIEYECGGATLPDGAKNKFNYEESVTLPVLSRDYYVFGGWFESESFNGDAVTRIPANTLGNKKFYAKWTAIRYAVDFSLDGGTNAAANQTENGIYYYTVESDDLTLENPIKEGYEFLGWERADGTKISKITSDAPSSFTVFAKWKILIFSITYDFAGGEKIELPTSFSVTDGDISLSAPNRKGHVFDGWFYADDESFQTKILKIEPKRTLENISLVAKWSVKTYTITYFLDFGENDAGNPTEYTINDANITLKGAVFATYVFDGWFENEEFDGEPVEIIQTARCENICLYGKFTEIAKFKLETVNGVNVVTEYNYEVYGSEVIIPEIIDGKTVGGVANGIFKNAASVNIKARLTEISADLFAECNKLKTVVLPSTLLTMPEGVFKDCALLESVTVPFIGLKKFDGADGKYYPFSVIFGSENFVGAYAVNLYQIDVREGKGSVDQTASIGTRYLPSSLKSITVLDGGALTYSMSGLLSVETINFVSKNTVTFESRAFDGCTGLKNLSFPKYDSAQNVQVSKGAFMGCDSLELITAYGDGETTDAFYRQLAAALEKALGVNWQQQIRFIWKLS